VVHDVGVASVAGASFIGERCNAVSKTVLVFPVGPEFKDLPIDGYEISLNPGAN
jgi:hypothetical protein